MKPSEIRELSQEQIDVEMRAMERRVFDLRTQAVTEKLKVPSELTRARRDIARLKTILHERELTQAAEQGVGN
ncbi:MAG: 50S ribosomal protein L29 [Planctomycetia bacterium]|nr:50S ribosomal protein L29 [Planctomycetia bacterium]